MGEKYQPSLAHWVQVLCGVEPERTLRALALVTELRSPSAERELIRDNVDAAVAAVLLIEGMDELESESGVPRARLEKKLRTEEFWSTWTEIRVAATLRGCTESPMRFELEPGRAHGSHPDWAFTYDDDDEVVPIEVKAVGLSDTEQAFCKRMAPALARAVPQTGFVTGHAPIDALPPTPTKAQRREIERGAREQRRSAGPLFAHLGGIRGAAIVGHDTDASYRRRIANKISVAAKQLPTDKGGWVALYWSNGASIQSCTDTIDWDEIPSHVEGIVFVGHAVAFPDANIHCYAAAVPRGLPPGTESRVQSMESPATEQLATAILRRFEMSAGVRPTLLRVGRRTLIERDGTRRISPFNLLIDQDPQTAEIATRWDSAPGRAD